MLIIRRLIALMQHLVSSSVSVRSLNTLRENWFSLNLYTERTLTEDDTRCCFNAICLLMMSI